MQHLAEKGKRKPTNLLTYFTPTPSENRVIIPWYGGF